MFKVGLYEREITPPFGANLCGYFNARPVSGVKDRTYARGAVIECAKTKIALISVEACEISAAIIDEIKSRISSLSDIEYGNILVAATHSHTAAPGEIDPPKETEKTDKLYLSWLALVAADTVLCANARLRESVIKFTEAEVTGTTFVRNYLMKDGSKRTNPGVGNPDIVSSLGTPDNTAPVLIIEDTDGRARGMIYSFANHQDSVDGDEVSADWSGVVSSGMKKRYGEDFVSIFFIGTAGDVNQVDVNNTDPCYRPECLYRELGEAFLEAVLPSLDKGREVSEGISLIRDTAEYKTRVMTKDEEKKQREILAATPIPEGMKLDAASPKELFFACMAKRAIIHNETANEYTRVNFQIIKLGEILIFALPGEVFTEYGKRIRAAFPHHSCFFACLANNGWSYMPTKDRYAEGLYESLFGSAKFYPEDTERIFDRFIELGKKLTKDSGITE